MQNIKLKILLFLFIFLTVSSFSISLQSEDQNDSYQEEETYAPPPNNGHERRHQTSKCKWMRCLFSCVEDEGGSGTSNNVEFCMKFCDDAGCR